VLPLCKFAVHDLDTSVKEVLPLHALQHTVAFAIVMFRNTVVKEYVMPHASTLAGVWCV
jgi:hypothetical protein